MKGTVLYTASVTKPPRKSKSVSKAPKMECDIEEGSPTNCQSFQQQALEIREPGEDFDYSIVPTDGEEFLMRMLYERKQCPAVMVRRPEKCNNENSAEASMNGEGTTVEKAAAMCVASLDMLPTKEWKQVQVDDFEGTRQKITMLREALNAQRYDQTLEPPLTTDAVEWQTFCRQHEPLLSTILRLSQRTLEQLLEFINEWLQDDEIDVEMTEVAAATEPTTSSSSDAAACTAVENAAPVPAASIDLAGKDEWIGAWLYAALTCLHMPLEPDVHSTLRDIARICIRLREHLPPQELDKASAYNLFIYLIAKVFGQLDFAEYV